VSQFPTNSTRKPEGSKNEPGIWLSGLMWFITVLMLVMLLWVVSQRAGRVMSFAPEGGMIDNILSNEPAVNVDVPEFVTIDTIRAESVTRLADVHTVIPERKRDTLTSYEVEPGDSVFSIAKQFNIKPETVLWANEDILQDNPNELSIGQNLRIPSVDGVIYKWKSTDSIENIARKFKAEPDDILTWPDNNLDMADPKIPSGTMVMIPGGSRELRTWVVPTFWRANSGANKTINEGCDTSGGSAYGSGTFVWPASNRSVSGNDFWSGHLGIDIAAATGAPVYAADSGVVVYSGSISGGYGYMVMIDHGNGFHTLYAHNSQLVARCGQNVGQGQTIAYAGSTGNSTGPHLHFEIRYMGAFVNPWDYLR
jgi:murein DD-endopeptidase MepM/ murein hydrolase activator NlpD